MGTPFSRRRSGVLLHITSLPGRWRFGDIGPEAYHFVDFLASTGQTVWQVLPLTPPDHCGSPYQSLSVHAADTRLISIDRIIEWGWLPADVSVQDDRQALLVRAYSGFVESADDADRVALTHFVQEEGARWLNDYALFLALKQEHKGKSWHHWETPFRDRDATALASARERYQALIYQIIFEQFVFARQWKELRHYANDRGVLMFGDMPIFVAHDSADVWANRDYFSLDDTGQPITVAGVPPDYFSATGQRWGNPHYRWDRMQIDDFRWWRERIASEMNRFDIIRIDHFRGFEAYWEIPASEATAIAGRWVSAPGDRLFASLKGHFDYLPFVAEDLGVITEAVTQLRERYGMPGMKILQFAFGSGANNPYLSHHHERNSVVYTGTHDNDTTVSWYEGLSTEMRSHVNDYLGDPSEVMPWPLIRTALASISCLAVIPMQDILALGKGQRMNTPGTQQDNWTWRFKWPQLPEESCRRLQHLTELYGRAE